MGCTVTVVGRSIDSSCTDFDNLFTGEKIYNDAIIDGGKSAGICYMPDDYLSNGIQDETKAFKRAKMNLTNGHSSVFEHFHISFIIECSKMMAMILNSTRLYTTSEKSARYTKMHAATETEQELYTKWTDKFTELLKENNEDNLTDKEINKLAIENARYVLSVFTPTTMKFTIPFGRAMILIDWLEQFIVLTNTYKKYSNEYDKAFYNRICDETADLIKAFKDALGITDETPVLHDARNMGIDLFEDIANIRKLQEISPEDEYTRYVYFNASKTKNYGNQYKDNYRDSYIASLACIAQMQRHRTISISISEYVNVPMLSYYIPELIIHNEELLDEWITDLELLNNNGITPQAKLFRVIEQGRFEDFVLKCKERMCRRAQLEISKITYKQIEAFYASRDNLSYINRKILGTMVADIGNKYIPLCRCQFKGYSCKEPCKFKKTIKDRKY